MKIRTEASGLNGRSISVELDTDDGRNTFSDWESWSTADQFKRLSAKADSLLIFYMAREHMITPEQARSRLAALREAQQ